MKTALVHDWLLSPTGGSENTFREIHSLFPSPVYTLLSDPAAFPSYDIRNSFIHKLPHSLFRAFLPLFPLAIQQFDLSAFDLILSSSHCVAKNIRIHPHQLHICYCHTPMRYAYSPQFLPTTNPLSSALARLILPSLRRWDTRSTPHHFIANSHHIARRILRAYNRPSTVIHPPVDTAYFTLHPDKQNYYVTASRLVSYKRIDLIVQAFSTLPHTLFVIGDGPTLPHLRRLATPNIHFLGHLPQPLLRHHLQRAKAFVFAAIEDFGIAPVEAMATGTPVIALGQGGALETIAPHTGLFFEEQTAASLTSAIRRFEQMTFDPTAISIHAQKFSKERFRVEFDLFVREKLNSR